MKNKARRGVQANARVKAKIEIDLAEAKACLMPGGMGGGLVGGFVDNTASLLWLAEIC